MRWSSSFFAIFAALGLTAASVQATELRDLKVLEFDGGTRAVLELSGPASYRMFTLENPRRLVIDLDATQPTTQFRLPGPNGVVASLRTGRPTVSVLRVVFDLGDRVSPRANLATQAMGSRLTVEMTTGHAPDRQRELARTDVMSYRPPQSAQLDDPVKTQPVQIVAASLQPSSPPSVKVPLARTLQDVIGSGQRKLVVAIDAGHGGKDPGAHGPSGVHEKDVTLAVARELARQINSDPGMKAVLIRDGDSFVPLQNRYMKARAAQADLFISIHADASPNQTATGASVFVLSTRGASSQAARWLADSENAADLVGGVSLDDKDRNLSAVLLDLSQSATMRASDDVAGQVLNALKNVGKAHKREIERANFVVLRSPDVPSMLVETGFITNPDEEQKLDDPGYRNRLASAITSGVRQYFTVQAPPGSLYASRQGTLQLSQEHVVARGETMSMIAALHGVPLASLRAANNKREDRVRLGEHLLIPAAALASTPK